MSKSLEDLAVISYGKDYKSNPKGDAEIPIIGTGGLMGYTTVALNKGASVLTGRKGSINNPIYVEGEFWNVDTIFCIKAKKEVSTKWLYYNLCNTDLSKLNEATGVPSVNSASLYRLRFKNFDIKSQTKIAQILTTIDNVIEKTETAIAKYEAIKQGMMQDFFTRGIGANGELRPSYEEAPELYQESALGWIPREWEVKRLEDFLEMKSGDGITSKTITEVGEYPVYGGNGLRGYTDRYTHEGLFILVGRQGALCGNIVLADRRFYASEHAVVVTILDSSDTLWLRAKLDSLNLNQYSESSAQPGLSVGKILKLKISLPPAEEQKKASLKMKSIDGKIEAEQRVLNKQTQLKQGLMQDLLTGKVSVKS